MLTHVMLCLIIKTNHKLRMEFLYEKQLWLWEVFNMQSHRFGIMTGSFTELLDSIIRAFSNNSVRTFWFWEKKFSEEQLIDLKVIEWRDYFPREHPGHQRKFLMMPSCLFRFEDRRHSWIFITTEKENCSEKKNALQVKREEIWTLDSTFPPSSARTRPWTR